MTENDRLFFETGPDLAEAGAAYPREIAEAGEQAAALRAAEALALSRAAHDKETLAQQGVNALSEQLTTLREEHEARTKEYFIGAFFDRNTDHGEAALESAERAQVIGSITSALEYGREYLAPELRLTCLRADELLYRDSAQLSSWTALLSAVNRFELSQPLAGAEGAVTFAAVGKTNSLFEIQLRAHKKAADASEQTVREEQRQRQRKEMI